MSLIGRIARTFIENSIREIVTEIYTGYTKQSRQILPPGIDSCPLPEDQGVIIQLDRTNGKTVSIGVYPDPQAQAGEIRFYSRDSGGQQTGEIYLKTDGTIEVNGNTDYAVRYTGYDTDLQSIITQINSNLTLIATAITSLGGTYVPVPVVQVTTGSRVDTVRLP